MTMENAQQPAPKTITLPASRAAQTWDRATDALVLAAEKAESEAKADYEAAKDRYQAARQHAHLIRQLRQLARVDGQSMAAVIREAKPVAIRTHHVGRHAASGICRGCPPAQEAQTHGD